VETEMARVKKTAVAADAFGNAEIDPSSLSRWAEQNS
jgi:hypothetical protein